MPIERHKRVEYIWKEIKENLGDYLSVIKDMTKDGYYINFSAGGSQNQTRIGRHYTDKQEARKDAVKFAKIKTGEL